MCNCHCVCSQARLSSKGLLGVASTPLQLRLGNILPIVIFDLASWFLLVFQKVFLLMQKSETSRMFLYHAKGNHKVLTDVIT
jgi:hypothetical protein